MFVGETESFGAEYADVYVQRVNASGDTLWRRVYGGSNYDTGSSIAQTLPDSGFIIAGTTHSFGAPYAPYADVYLLKINGNGDTLWTRTYTDDGRHQRTNCVRQTPDGGFIVVGEITNPVGYDESDMYVLKTDGDGQVEWDVTYSVLWANDYAYSVDTVADSGYVIVGRATAI